MRKLALTLHVTSSVAWLGAVASFLALAIVGVASGDLQLIRGVYLAMHASAWFVILPLSVVSLLTGLVQGLVTPWGLFRHYWVIVKLVINLLSTTVLLLYMQSLEMLRDQVRAPEFTTGSAIGLRAQAIVHSAAALVLLTAAVVVSIYKPRGKTRFGWRYAKARAGRM